MENVAKGISSFKRGLKDDSVDHKDDQEKDS